MSSMFALAELCLPARTVTAQERSSRGLARLLIVRYVMAKAKYNHFEIWVRFIFSHPFSCYFS